MTDVETYNLVMIRNFACIYIHNLTDQSDRTLLLGKDCSLNKVHVYCRGGVLVRYLYEGKDSPSYMKENLSIAAFAAFSIVYSRESDYEFCKLLTYRGCKLPLIVGEIVPDQQYYGPLVESERS